MKYIKVCVFNVTKCRQAQDVWIRLHPFIASTSMFAGARPLQKQQILSGYKVGAHRRSAEGWNRAPRRLERRKPGSRRDDRREWGAHEKGGVICKEQQHVPGMCQDQHVPGMCQISLKCSFFYDVTFCFSFQFSFKVIEAERQRQMQTKRAVWNFRSTVLTRSISINNGGIFKFV